MADASRKHLPINGGFVVTDMKSLSCYIRRRRSMAFASGFMFAFVTISLFLAFNPLPHSLSPLFSVFRNSNGSFRSRFSPVFSHFLPTEESSSSRLQPVRGSVAQNPTVEATDPSVRRSQAAEDAKSVNDSKSSPPTTKLPSKFPALGTESKNSSEDMNPRKFRGSIQDESAASSLINRSSPVIEKHNHYAAGHESDGSASMSRISSISASEIKNSSVLQNPKNTNLSEVGRSDKSASVKQPSGDEGNHNSTINGAVYTTVAPGSTADPSSSLSNSSMTEAQKRNTTSSLSDHVRVPTGSNSTSDGHTSLDSAKKSTESMLKELKNCNFFDGEWVMDDSYPLYTPGSCSWIDEQFNCVLNGRPDHDYHKYRWKPHGCTLPRLNGEHMLEMLRGKRLVFVGDSLNRNMWESLLCILKNAAKDKTRVYEVNGRRHFRGESSYSFIFKDYNCSVEFFVSPFLVREWEFNDGKGSKRETLRLDLVGHSSNHYKAADIMVFNTGHWWTHEKTSLGKDFYQEGSHVYGKLGMLEAFRRALTTWARWVDGHVNPMKSLVFFRGYSSSHFGGGKWNAGGACDGETEPIKNDTYLIKPPSLTGVLERVLKGMRTPVRYLNITRLTDYRKDAHPSVYRTRRPSEEERRAPLRFQDCSHWCLPGVPDIWNEILYAELLRCQG